MRTDSISPVFPVGDIDAAIRFYTEVMEFELDFHVANYAAVSLDGITLHLSARRSHPPALGLGMAYVMCDTVDDYYAGLVERGAVLEREIADTPYGMREFMVRDPDGNHISFGSEMDAA